MKLITTRGCICLGPVPDTQAYIRCFFIPVNSIESKGHAGGYLPE